MKLTFDNNSPIYLQIVEQLKIYIISGILKPGERLPSVRELALQTKVNPNTMQKSLTELENLKLIYTERTNGKYITTDINLINKYKEQEARNLSNQFLINMQKIGLNKNETINYLKKIGGNNND